jgi:CTP:molybdopterin cytidylyltransferase MocA
VETVRGVFETVVVVTGHQRDRVEEALARSPVTFVDSPAEHGAAAAIEAGVASARQLLPPPSRKGIVLCIGDQPRLTEREIVGLVEVYEAGDRSKPLIPVRDEKRGYPVVIPPDFDLRGIDLSSDNAAADFAGRLAIFRTRNPVYDSSVDTPEDYRTFFAI